MRVSTTFHLSYLNRIYHGVYERATQKLEAKLTSVQRNSANFINLANYSSLSLANLICHTIYKGLSPYPEKFCKFLQLLVRDHGYHSHCSPEGVNAHLYFSEDLNGQKLRLHQRKHFSFCVHLCYHQSQIYWGTENCPRSLPNRNLHPHHET